MKPGTKVRCDCNACDTEFEVVLEPKAAAHPTHMAGMPSQKVASCPFCGSTDVTTDEDEDE